VVRRHLPAQARSKFDSTDVLQSVWVHVLRNFQKAGQRFASPDHLRAFLVMVTRHRLTDRLRYYHHALEREQPAHARNLDRLRPSSEPRPSELAQAEELWQNLLKLCPPAHREILQLKRNGLRLADIAGRTGMHEDSIRRILRQLARELAFTNESAAAASDASL
jgi:RNA polymerase sigma-70 factor (ECF subfamily)